MVAIEYNNVVSLSEKEFRARTARSCGAELLDNPDLFTKANYEEIAKVERLLDVKPGTLQGDDYYLQKHECPNCGRLLTTYDFVFTGLVDAEHSKSLILHTFVGSKFVVNNPRPVRCSACGLVSVASDATLEAGGGDIY